jgi:hypothetical protein
MAESCAFCENEVLESAGDGGFLRVGVNAVLPPPPMVEPIEPGPMLLTFTASITDCERKLIELLKPPPMVEASTPGAMELGDDPPIKLGPQQLAQMRSAAANC